MFAMVQVNYACDTPGESPGSGDSGSGGGGGFDSGSTDIGDETGPSVELTVIEIIPVDFGDMQGGVGEDAIIDLADLREEAAYVETRPELNCGSLNPAMSFIEVEALQADAGSIMLDYEVAVAPRGAQYTRLATFEDAVMVDDKVSLADSRFTLDPAGLRIVSQVVLGDWPALSLSVSASVPGGVSDLQVALSISIDFSSQPEGCRP